MFKIGSKVKIITERAFGIRGVVTEVMENNARVKLTEARLPEYVGWECLYWLDDLLVDTEPEERPGMLKIGDKVKFASENKPDMRGVVISTTDKSATIKITNHFWNGSIGRTYTYRLNDLVKDTEPEEAEEKKDEWVVVNDSRGRGYVIPARMKLEFEQWSIDSCPKSDYWFIWEAFRNGKLWRNTLENKK